MLPWGFPTTHHFVNAATKRVAAHTRTQCKSPQGTTATLHCGTRTRRMLSSVSAQRGLLVATT